jgi:glycosyltransferase involved in cell wall biosynthesis
MIESVQKWSLGSWEIIVVDDNSEDDLFSVVEEYSKRDSRIKIAKNNKKGKVTALNMGYKLSSGNIIKCVDSDDTFASAFFDNIDTIITSEAVCHDYYIVDSKFKKIAKYTMNQKFFTLSYTEVLRNLISLPRAVWSFRRELAEKIFPLPEGLPYEDIWFSLIIKKHAKEIKYLNKPLYNYRQHESQTFGGVLNYNTEKTIFRANRLVNFISCIEDNYRIVDEDEKNILDEQKQYYMYLAKEVIRLKDILFSGLSLKKKLKIMVFRKMNKMLPAMKRIQWSIDNAVSRLKSR